jgi:hypothetical protein
MLEKLLNNCCQITDIWEDEKACSNGFGQSAVIKGIFNNDFELRIIIK